MRLSDRGHVVVGIFVFLVILTIAVVFFPQLLTY